MKNPRPLQRLLSPILAAIMLTGLTLHAAPVQSAQAEGFSLFQPPVSYPVGGGPNDIAIGDINGDGDLDIVTLIPYTGNLGVLTNQGDGTFSTSFQYGITEMSRSVNLHDMDGDGDLDMIFADAGLKAVVIVTNDGSGTFTSLHPPFPVGDYPINVVVADFNNDDKPDLAASNLQGESVSILLNSGTGSFFPQVEYLTDLGPAFLAVDDFNLDGNPDLVATNAGGTTVSVLLGKGDGTFQAKTDYGVGPAPSVVIAEDLNNDGRTDLAVASSLGDDVSILQGYGDGTFGPKAAFTVGVKPYGMTAGDFNGDGKIDLVTASFETDNLTLLLNQGGGVFAPAVYYPAGGTSSTVRSGDLNNDGKLDLVTENENSAIVVLMNASLNCGQDGSACYVTPIGTGDCSSWANACGLQTALAAAQPGSEIWVAAGTYTPTNGTDRTATFTLKDDVAIYGGFTGTETERSQRDWEENVTILSGEIGEPYEWEDNSCNVVSATNVGRNTVLDGFQIKNGYCDGNDLLIHQGGGMKNYQNASPTLRNLIISNNIAGRGGGMYNGQNSNPTLEHVYFLNNHGNIGGAMTNEDSSNPTVTDALFQGNNALTHGGGIFNTKNSNSLLVHVTFYSNSADYSGGGIWNVMSHITLIDVVFENNMTSIGGAIDNCGSMILQNATFEKNTGNRGGAISNRCEASAVVANAVFLDNDAREEGGAIYNHLDSQIHLTNATFYGNRAGLGGSMNGSIDSPIFVRNSIVWNDLGTNSYTTFDHSIVQGIANDPASGVYGDEAHTPIFVDTANSDFRLAENSPGVDDGLNTWLPADTFDLDKDGNVLEPLPVDIAGKNRIRGTTVDLGAYEAEEPIPMAVDDTIPAFDEDTTQTLNVMANDKAPYGGALTITAVTQGSKGSVSIQGGMVRYEPHKDVNGTDSFTYTVADGNGFSDTAAVYITILPVNDAPTLSDFADVQIVAGETFTIDFTVDDAETAPNLLTVLISTLPNPLLPPGSIAVTGTDRERTMRITPVYHKAGVVTVTVNVVDKDHGISEKQFVVTVIRKELDQRFYLPVVTH